MKRVRHAIARDGQDALAFVRVNAGVIDKDVQTVSDRCEFSGRSFDAFGIAHVEREELRTPALRCNYVCRLFAARIITRSDDDVKAASSKLPCRFKSNAAIGTSNECNSLRLC
jgi:hypothetical protein